MNYNRKALIEGVMILFFACQLGHRRRACSLTAGRLAFFFRNFLRSRKEKLVDIFLAILR